MKSLAKCLVLCLASLCIVGSIRAATPPASQPTQKLVDLDLWSGPADLSQGEALPALAAMPQLDGQLDEWSSAAGIAVRNAALVSEVARYRKYGGPADVSMELHLAWRAEGLCLAGELVDNDILAMKLDKRPTDMTMVDGVTLLIDTRTDAFYRTALAGKGLFEVGVYAPQGDAPAKVYFDDQDAAAAAGVKTASLKTPRGYTFEMVIPWALLNVQAGRAGNHVAISYALRDRDSEQSASKGHIALTHRAARYKSPEAFIDWQLVDAPKDGIERNLAAEVAIDTPMVFTAKPADIAINLAQGLSSRQGATTITLTDSSGKSVSVSVTAAADAVWGKSLTIIGQVDPAQLALGAGTITVTVTGKDQKVIGSAKRLFIAAGNAGQQLNDEFTGVAAMAKDDPYKANAYMGAAATLQRFKRLSLRPGPLAGGALRETVARLMVLRDGRLTAKSAGFFDLLNLTADATAQVDVEYESAERAIVSVYCGSVPLVRATVQQWPNELAVQNAIKNWDGDHPWVWSQPAMFNDLPGRAIVNGLQPYRMGQMQYDPEKHFILWKKGGRAAMGAELNQLKLAHPAVCCIQDDTPEAVKVAVEAWAAAGKIAKVDLPAALGAETALIVGGKGGSTFQNRPLTRTAIGTHFSGLIAGCGNRTFDINSPSRPVAEMMVALLRDGKAITPAQSDELRKALLSDLPPVGAPAEAAPLADLSQAIQACDLHMHTVYSDGTCAPSELAMRGMYTFLDFMAITDHDQVAGAQLAQRELAGHNVAFPIIVGQEVTEKDFHCNAWPVTTLISNKLAMPDIIQAAHAQGALLQYNHPGYPGSPWQKKTILNHAKDYDFDAIEHINDLMGEFRQAGVTLPFTGTSDIHAEALGMEERTLIQIGSFSQDNFKAAMKACKVAAISHWGSQWIYGEQLEAPVRALLADGGALKAAKAQRIGNVLQKADLSAWLKDSELIRGKIATPAVDVVSD